MTTTVNIHEAKTHLSRLLKQQVAAGERVVISKAGRPIADLVPHQAASVTFGGLKGEVACTTTHSTWQPNIQEMFYGDAASSTARPCCGCWMTTLDWGRRHQHPGADLRAGRARIYRRDRSGN